MRHDKQKEPSLGLANKRWGSRVSQETHIPGCIPLLEKKYGPGISVQGTVDVLQSICYICCLSYNVLVYITRHGICNFLHSAVGLSNIFNQIAAFH
jgi:hypothetical protein